MEPKMPPSPAPSNDDIFQHGLHHLMGHTSNQQGKPADYSVAGEDSPISTRHSTPIATREATRQFGRYGLPHGQSTENGPTDTGSARRPGYEASHGAYRPVPGDDRPPARLRDQRWDLDANVDKVSRAYGTPDTSPPIPPRLDSLTTRSGLSIPKGPVVKSLPGKASRVEKPTSRKRKERVKAPKRSDKLLRPLSELAIAHSNVMVADIEAYVHRSAEERRREVELCKTPGKIKRPMNAFMLYRKAYQNLAKSLCTQNNHQVVSQVCGDGWPLEPEHIREQFNEWARIERANHQSAHPGYKFTPAKPKKKLADDSGDESDAGEREWNRSGAGPESSSSNVPADHARSSRPLGLSTSPLELQSCYQPPHVQPPPTVGLGTHGNTECVPAQSTKLTPLAVPYGHGNPLAGQYYQPCVQPPSPELVEGMYLRKVQAALHPTDYSALTVEGFDISGPYHLWNRPQTFDSFFDPSLVPHHGSSLYGDIGLDGQQRWHPQLGVADIAGEPSVSFSNFDDALDPELLLLQGPDNGWQVQELEADQVGNWLGHQE